MKIYRLYSHDLKRLHSAWLDVGSDTNILKFGLNIFREILEKALNISKNFLNISPNFLNISKYPGNSESLKTEVLQPGHLQL